MTIDKMLKKIKYAREEVSPDEMRWFNEKLNQLGMTWEIEWHYGKKEVKIVYKNL